MAEGFEPSDGGYPQRFRGVLLRPLGHATVWQPTEHGTVYSNRCLAKNASSGAAHSCASTPPTTEGDP